ncbi:MAG: transcriptional repressor [Opitutae bacterium]|nr:transcriptional repressor [Opitutae bacterium]
MISATQSNHPLAGHSSPEATEAAVTEARRRIRAGGLRITRPRLALIASLHRHEGPVSIERIHLDVGAEACDLVTVYRSLAAFEGIGLVRRSYLHNGTCLYELTLNAQQRYHIVCKTCGATERVDYVPIEGPERLLAARGYTQVSHVVEFFGVCPQCQTAAAARRVAPALPRERV